MNETSGSVRVPARAHLAGNPSDVHDGAVLSTAVPELAAHVAVTESAAFEVLGPARRWWTLDDLVAEARHHGHEGGDRLVTAALVAADRIVSSDVPRRPGRFEWWTNIPRSVGLGGSSAIVIATMRAALRWWGVEGQVDPLVLARAALDAEVAGLGISAGLADRAAQALDGVVLTDCRSAEPRVQYIVPARAIDAQLLWNPDAAAPSTEYHRELRARIDTGESHVLECLASLAALADQAADAVANGDLQAFGEALDASLRARTSLGSVPSAAFAPVEALRAHGAHVNFAGSGGALVVVGDAPVPEGWTKLELTIG